MATEAEQIEMDRLGVTEEAKTIYRYGGYSYQSLKDALNYAEHVQQKGTP